MKSLLAALVLVSASPVWAQQLWQGTSVGMTREQVMAVVPEAALQPNSDGSTSLVVPEVRIAGAAFRASFGFKEDGLTGVRLSSSPTGAGEINRIGASLLEALRAKYGAEVNRESTSIGQQYTWAAGRTTIKLDVIRLGLIQVLYGASIARDADKL